MQTGASKYSPTSISKIIVYLNFTSHENSTGFKHAPFWLSSLKCIIHCPPCKQKLGLVIEVGYGGEKNLVVENIKYFTMLNVTGYSLYVHVLLIFYCRDALTQPAESNIIGRLPRHSILFRLERLLAHQNHTHKV